jgi:hypothetical protein
VNGGLYTSIPAILLLCVAAMMIICLVLGCCGACKDSKLTLMLVRKRGT